MGHHVSGLKEQTDWPGSRAGLQAFVEVLHFIGGATGHHAVAPLIQIRGQVRQHSDHPFSLLRRCTFKKSEVLDQPLGVPALPTPGDSESVVLWQCLRFCL